MLQLLTQLDQHAAISSGYREDVIEFLADLYVRAVEAAQPDTTDQADYEASQRDFPSRWISICPRVDALWNEFVEEHRKLALVLPGQAFNTDELMKPTG